MTGKSSCSKNQTLLPQTSKPVSKISDLEVERLVRQELLDAERTALERNKLGQFATPPELAEDIVRAALARTTAGRLNFLEPSCGSGSFFSALLRCCERERLGQAIGVELDERFAATADDLWGPSGLEVVRADFTNWAAHSDYRADLLIANPPYVRHHHLLAEQKAVLPGLVESSSGIRPSGLAGLYVYFVLLSHRLLAPGAISAWLIPSEFLDVNYGKALKQYLREEVTTLQIHQFDPLDVQFDDALVTSTVIIFENTSPSSRAAKTAFTFGGSVSAPTSSQDLDLSGLPVTGKWSRCWTDSDISGSDGPVLGDVFKVRRGIATGSNKFFIRPRAEILQRGISERFVQPILPSGRYITSLVVESEPDGWPRNVEQLGLLGSGLPEDELKELDPLLWEYFCSSPDSVRDAYLVRGRKPWYRQELREPSPFLCTYMGRGVDEDHPFRFIRNRSQAIATNVFLMLYPTAEVQPHLAEHPETLESLHDALLGYTATDLRRGGRVYGGGLHKIEPKELTQLPADRLVKVLPEGLFDRPEQQELWA